MDELSHYGILEKSGRFPWGSGENPYQRLQSFSRRVQALKDEGYSEAQIAKQLGIKTTQLRARITISKEEIRAQERAEALRLKDKGWSNTAIGKHMGKNESSIRSLLDPVLAERASITRTTADILKANISEHRYIDVGHGTENRMGITKTKLKTALALLEEEGYKKHYVKVPQTNNPGKFTYVHVMTKDDISYSEVFKNQEQIKVINHYSEDGGRSYLGLEPIRSVDSDRVQIVYKEDGGAKKDGAIELRMGVDDISLGNSRYAQVRIGVDDKYFMKGMAIYSDKLPPGIDILYNTNKPKGTPPEDVFKDMKDDSDNPFGAIVRQKHYIDIHGNKQLSALNIIGSKEGSHEEGGWNEWAKRLSSQFLSKQPIGLAKQQLDLAYKIKLEEYDDILKLTNPTIKERLLLDFAGKADSDAVDLHAAALPRQRNQVLLPLTDIPENQIYAPNYRNGEKVVLIRHPHGGKFEIPELVVNNKHPQGIKLLGRAQDGVGINYKVAERLSGADFDGDTVLVIPNNKNMVKTSAPLKGLENFDPHEMYPKYEGMRVMSKASIQKYMGDISNLITDMTIQGAKDHELAAAVRHSMVVIDAHKHELNFRQSAIDNNIASLKKRYQGRSNAGAATLISKAKSEERVPERIEGDYRKDPVTKKERIFIFDPSTGEKLYRDTGNSYIDAKGNVKEYTTRTTKMAEVKDAYDLSSGTRMESIYADHANKLKALANEARKEAIKQPKLEYSPSANKAYKEQVASLNAHLNIALMNAPLERQALIQANHVARTKLQDNPHLTKGDMKKIKQQALDEQRMRAGASKQHIKISPKEWEAIQAGAISNSKLIQILNNADIEVVKEYATPRNSIGLTPARKSRALSMIKSGFTQAEIADQLGVSVGLINDLIKDSK